MEPMGKKGTEKLSVQLKRHWLCATCIPTVAGQQHGHYGCEMAGLGFPPGLGYFGRVLGQLGL